jgi:RNA polymerase sigma-70 factor (ECF subfamily)
MEKIKIFLQTMQPTEGDRGIISKEANINNDVCIDSDSFWDVEMLLDKYADMVYKIALNQMKNKSDADDIFQEVFLRLVEYRQKLQSEEHAKAWLIRVTINCCKKHFLSGWHKYSTPLDEAVLSAEKWEEKDQFLYDAVASLPREQRIVIHLFYYEGYAVKEIVDILQMKEGTIKSQLFRARNSLREIL